MDPGPAGNSFSLPVHDRRSGGRTLAVMCVGWLIAGCGAAGPPSKAESLDAGASADDVSAPDLAKDAARPLAKDASSPTDAASEPDASGPFDAAASDAPAGMGGKVTVYDLKADWSDTQNPNGVWSLREGNNLFPAVENWGGSKGQRAWCKARSGSGHIPVILKVSVMGFEAKEAQIGDLIVHAQDEIGGPGLGQAQIVWTAPASGTVDIKAGLWLGRLIGRSDDWTLTIAGVQKSMGKVAAGHDRNNPVPISETNVPIAAGQTIVLQISRSATCANTKTCAEFCDFLLTITLTQ